MGTQVGPSSSKLLSVEAIRAGEELDLNFICLMCKNWSLVYECVRRKKGRRLKKEEFRDLNCNKINCHGPMFGGIFDEYNGPLEGCMVDFCYVCGGRAIYFIERSGDNNVWSIGICADHINVLSEAEISLKEGIKNEQQDAKRN